MGINILYDPKKEMVALFDSETERAFSPVFTETNNVDPCYLAEKFIKWLQGDIRKMDADELLRRRDMFMNLKWKECPWTCPTTLIQGDEESCQACLHECGVCYASGATIETEAIIITERMKDGLKRQRRVRACKECRSNARISV